jgi:hypothetical protein
MHCCDHIECNSLDIFVNSKSCQSSKAQLYGRETISKTDRTAHNYDAVRTEHTLLWDRKQCVCTQTQTHTFTTRWRFITVVTTATQIHFTAAQPVSSPHSTLLRIVTSPKRSLFLLRGFKTKCFTCCVPARYSANCTAQFLYRYRTATVGGQLQRTAACSAQVATAHRHRYDDVMQLCSHLQVQYSTVQFSTVQFSTVQHSTVHYSTVQYSTAQYSTA